MSTAVDHALPVPPVRYVRTSDGYNIAFKVVGKGPPLVVLQPNSHLALIWEVPSLRAHLSRLATRFTLINLDPHGMGLSDREVSTIETDALVNDITAVLNSIDVKQVSLLGGGIASPIALAFAAARPERTNRVVLTQAGLGNSVLNTAIRSLAVANGMLVTEARAAYVVGLQDPANASAYATLQRETRSPAVDALFQEWLADFNFHEVCSRIESPTLFIHAADDEMLPVSVAKAMTASTPGSVLKILPGKSGFDLRRNETLLDEIEGFLFADRNAVRVIRPNAFQFLSQREQEVLDLLAQGLTNKDIAARLDLSPFTISHYVTSIFNKTSTANRAELVAFAVR